MKKGRRVNKKNKIMIEFIIESQWLVFLIVAWTLPWKGWALWKAAKGNQKRWFIVLLVLNTLAILEILYIFVFSKKKTATPEPSSQ